MIFSDPWTEKFKDLEDIVYRPKPFPQMECRPGNEIAVGLRSERKWINPNEEDIKKIYDELDQFRSDLKNNNITHSFGYPILKLEGY